MISFILSIFLLISPVAKERSIFELEEIIYPCEIVIPKKWEEKEVQLEIKIYYIYRDINIIILPEERYFSADEWLSFKGKAYYYLKKKVKTKDIEGNLLRGHFGRGEEVLYANGAIYSFETTLPLLEDDELRDSITKKELSKILVWLDELRIRWEIKKGKVMIYLHKEKGEDKIKINKTIEIKVKYEK